MARFLARRLLLSLVTLWLLATIVFIIANVLPNDVGRTILGPFAPQESVDALNERLGTDRPILVQYVDAMRALSPSTSETRSCPANRSCRSSSRDRSLGQAGRPRPAPHDPDQHRRRPVRRADVVTASGPGDRPARRDVVIDPRVRDRRRSWSSSSASSSGCCRSSRRRRRTPTSRPRSATC